MDDAALHHDTRDEADLAAIVLGHGRLQGAPERVPAWVDHTPPRGYDARSVAVLGLVVAVLAGLIGWATTIGDAAPQAADRAPSAAKVDVAASDTEAGSVAGAGSAESGAATTTPAPPAGIDLTASRLVANRSSSGTGVVSVSVRNAGAAPSRSTDASVLVLVDGAVVGSAPLGAVAPGASARVAVPMTWCPAGELPMVAMIDPTSVIREADERNNSISTRTSFGC